MRYEGSCHCGKIAFEVDAEFSNAIDCNCSLCRRRGSVLAFVPRGDLTLKTPAEDISTYTFNHHMLQHHFCATCGTAPFSDGKSPDGAAMAAINLRCIPAVDLDAIQITHFDGKSR
jgi:hypothetical protein